MTEKLAPRKLDCPKPERKRETLAAVCAERDKLKAEALAFEREIKRLRDINDYLQTSLHELREVNEGQFNHVKEYGRKLRAARAELAELVLKHSEVRGKDARAFEALNAEYKNFADCVVSCAEAATGVAGMTLLRAFLFAVRHADYGAAESKVTPETPGPVPAATLTPDEPTPDAPPPGNYVVRVHCNIPLDCRSTEAEYAPGGKTWFLVMIKHLRECAYLSLKEAKDVMDNFRHSATDHADLPVSYSERSARDIVAKLRGGDGHPNFAYSMANFAYSMANFAYSMAKVTEPPASDEPETPTGSNAHPDYVIRIHCNIPQEARSSSGEFSPGQQRWHIPMIKYLREHLHIGLKEAKDIVDHFRSPFCAVHELPIRYYLDAGKEVLARLRGSHGPQGFEYDLWCTNPKDTGV